MYEILQQILNFFGHGFCHQYAERSLEAAGLFFCVCARCTGIYLGFVVTLAVVAMLMRQGDGSSVSQTPARQKNRPPVSSPVSSRLPVIVGVLLVVPMAIDGGGSYAGLFETTNLNRYITGYLGGMGLGMIASGGLATIVVRPGLSQRALGTPSVLVVTLLISASVGALFYLVYPFLGIAGPLISLASLWFTAAFVLLLIVSTTKLWTPATLAPRRAALVALCLLAALAVLAVFSLAASLLGFIVPW